MKVLAWIFHLFFALLALYTIAFDLAYGVDNVVNYFSLFTILSVGLASLAFLYLSLMRNQGKNTAIDSIRGAVTAYLLVSSAVYFLLLKDLPNSTLPWINTVFHQIMPTVFIADWLILPPKKHLKLKESFKWLVFPVVYLGYILVRGRIVNWYPYPFLNPGTSGYTSVFGYSAVMAIGGLLLSSVLIVAGNKLRDYSKSGD